jgi:outer membrane protein assembly factor BamB
VGSPSRFLFGIEAATGVERWRVEIGAAISCAPAWVDGKVLFGQQGGEDHFYCVSAQDGRHLWRQSLGWVWSSACIVGGRAYVPGVDGYVSCLEVDSGRIVWRYRTGRASHPEPASAAGIVIVGSWDHYIYGLDASSGRVVWALHTGGSPDSGASLIAGDRAFVPVGGTRFHCLDLATGTVRWKYQLANGGSFNASPAYHDGLLFVSVSVRTGAIPVAAKIVCLDAADGTPIWEHEGGGGLTAPVIAGGHVLCASTSGPYFSCLDERGNGDGTTRLLWRVRMGDRVDESVPAIWGDRACILDTDGWLTCIR